MGTKKITKSERRDRILELLAQEGTVEVNTLARLFACSEMSIRNDLRELNGEGKLQRKHGGAEIPHPASLEIPLSEREKSHYREKEWIGKAASTLVFNGDSIMIDAGTTTERIARHLEEFADLTVITNGINILSLLMRYPHINLYTIEGRVDHRSFSIVGQDAERTLAKYHARISFISVDGFTVDHGLMNDSFEATNISRILVANSQRRVLLVDSSKIGKVGMSLLGPATLIDTVITDSGIPEEYHTALKDLGIEVMIADEILGARQSPSLSRE